MIGYELDLSDLDRAAKDFAAAAAEFQRKAAEVPVDPAQEAAANFQPKWHTPIGIENTSGGDTYTATMTFTQLPFLLKPYRPRLIRRPGRLMDQPEETNAIFCDNIENLIE